MDCVQLLWINSTTKFALNVASPWRKCLVALTSDANAVLISAGTVYDPSMLVIGSLVVSPEKTVSNQNSS